MACPQCGSPAELMDGRCPACGEGAARDAAPPPACPQCQAPLDPQEYFCAKCGHKLQQTPEEKRRLRERSRARVEKAIQEQKVGKARKWILAVSILTLVGGVAMYFMGKSKVEEEIRNAETMTRSIDPAERDRLFKEQTGMTWKEAVAHDRGMVTLQLVVNIALAAIYFGLWFWARSNAFAASLIALLLFLTVVVVSGLFDPTTFLQGILIKILVVIALGSAVSAAYKERKLRAIAS